MTQQVLQLQWGWITPGTGESNRYDQCEQHLDFLAEPIVDRTRHFLFTHCGWWLDVHASQVVRDLTGKNSEPHRALTSCDRATADALRQHVASGRLEYILYPYAATVSEAISGESLLRTFRVGKTVVRDALGVSPRAMLNHDYCYGLDWAAAQMPRIAHLVGVQYVMSQLDGRVRGPDGSVVPTLATLSSPGAIAQSTPVGDKPVFVPLELHSSVHLHRRMQDGQFGNIRPDFLAIDMDRYLSQAAGDREYDGLAFGSKGWFGGQIDMMMQEQFARTVEMRLPAVEAMALLSGRKADLGDFWKRVWILLDNHTIWQCHDYKAHYLPRSRELHEELRNVERQLLGSEKNGANLAVYNAVPWKRDVVVADGDRSIHLRDVPGWGVSVVPRNRFAAARADVDTTTLTLGRASYRLGPAGEMMSASIDGNSIEFDFAGRLTRIVEQPCNETRSLPPGDTLADFEGSAGATTDIDLPAGAPPVVRLYVPDVIGAAFIVQSRGVRADGTETPSQWESLHSMHWGGNGMPRRQGEVNSTDLTTQGAPRLRVTLWMIAEGRISLGEAQLRDAGGNAIARGGDWSLHLNYRVAYAHPRSVKSQVVRSDDAMKTVRFTGLIPDASFTLDVTLAADDPSLRYDLKLMFDKPTNLGLTTPPLEAMDGTLLGCLCERPYIPGLVVSALLPREATYFADEPYYLRRMFAPRDHSWHTDQQDWWLGFSAIIGVNMACADWGAGQLALMTRGLRHFFRWKHDGREQLGLSLGATLIHQMTQGHTVADSCVIAKTAKRTTHDPYGPTPFLAAAGEYRFQYAFCPGASGESQRRTLWRSMQAYAIEPAACPTDAAPANHDGIVVEPADIVVTALEPVADGVLLRAFNLSGDAQTASIALPFDFDLVKPAPAIVSGRKIRMDFGPHAIVELTLAVNPHKHARP